MLELQLVSIERSSATVKCTITSAERVELERSSTYRAYARKFEEGLQFLNDQTPRRAEQTTSSRARQAA
jgi:hypothetical protein